MNKGTGYAYKLEQVAETLKGRDNIRNTQLNKTYRHVRFSIKGYVRYEVYYVEYLSKNKFVKGEIVLINLDDDKIVKVWDASRFSVRDLLVELGV